MLYQQPIGAAENAPYINANPAQGIEGSPVPAAAIEHPQREIINVIEKAGLVPDAVNLEQLYQAMLALIAARTKPQARYFLKAGTDTFIAPADALFKVWVIGAGGGTGGLRITVSQSANGVGHRFSVGGAAGGGGAFKIVSLERGQAVQIVVGEGGTPGNGGSASVAATDGGPGGTSSFGNLLTATGGYGSVAVNITSVISNLYCGHAQYAGGQGLGGDICVTGNPGLSPHLYRTLDLVTRNPGGTGAFIGGLGANWNTGEYSLGTGAHGMYVQGQNTPSYTAGIKGGDGAVIIEWTNSEEE